MSKRTKIRKMSPGTPNTSNSRNYKSNDRSSSKVSKYFHPIQNDISVESPYKDLLTTKDNIEPIEFDDNCDDFKTPKPVRVAKIFQMSKKNHAVQSKKDIHKKPSKVKPKNKSKPGKRSLLKNNMNIIASSVEDDGGVNTEHLQMAIALSKSEMQNSDDDNASNSVISSQQKMVNLKSALQQYGFSMRSKNKNCPLENSVIETNKRKKSKFKYLTPVLCTRTEEDRLELITNKISLIISSKTIFRTVEGVDLQVYTDDLKTFYAEDAVIFNKNGANSNNEEYFVPSLNIPHSTYIPGCLFKKWEDILGRDKSPVREDTYFKIKDHKLACKYEDTAVEEPTNKRQAKLNSSCMETTEIFSSKGELESLERNNDENAEKSMNNINSPLISNNYKIGCSQNVEMLSPDLFSSDDDDIPQETTEIFSSKGELKSLEINNDENAEKSIGSDVNSPLIFIGCSENVEMLSPDLFSADDEYITQESCVEALMKKTTSLTEDDSVIDITISQIDRFKQISVDSDFQNVHLEKILEDNASIRDHSFYSLDTLAQNNDCNDDLASNTKWQMQEEASFHDDKLIDLTNATDSDCHIIEDPKDAASTSRNKLKRFSSFNSTTSIDSNISRTSDMSIVISDEELNYSTMNSTSCKKHKSKRVSKDVDVESSLINMSSMMKEFGDKLNEPSRSDCSNFNEIDLLKRSSHLWDQSKNYNVILRGLDDIATKYIKETQESDKLNTMLNDEEQEDISPKHDLNGSNLNLLDPLNLSCLLSEDKDTQNSPISTANLNSLNQIPTVATSSNRTPKNDNFVIKTDITPLQNYFDMDTPKIASELRKFGLKPLKRKRGVQLLQYLYDATHPEVSDENVLEKEDIHVKELGTKRRKTSCVESEISWSSAATIHAEQIEIIGDVIDENDSINDLIFENRTSVKLSTCALPLNIAWHNFLAANSSIRESMLMYEPLEVERLYSMLKAQGFKYKIQDLVCFLDKKCITIRTKQNNGKVK